MMVAAADIGNMIGKQIYVFVIMKFRKELERNSD